MNDRYNSAHRRILKLPEPQSHPQEQPAQLKLEWQSSGSGWGWMVSADHCLRDAASAGEDTLDLLILDVDASVLPAIRISAGAQANNSIWRWASITLRGRDTLTSARRRPRSMLGSNPATPYKSHPKRRTRPYTSPTRWFTCSASSSSPYAWTRLRQRRRSSSTSRIPSSRPCSSRKSEI